MNQYKQTWMIACDILPHVRQSSPEPKQENTVGSWISQESTDWIVEHAAYAALTYMATSHYGKLRIVGSIGLRLIPVIAVAGIAYSVYKLFD